MQLGARWRTGEDPHRGVPPVLFAAISAAEREYPGAHSWTLTWLEGRAVVQLDAVLIAHVTPENTVSVRVLAEPSHSGASSAGEPFVSPVADRVALYSDGPVDDDEDDDWLN